MCNNSLQPLFQIHDEMKANECGSFSGGIKRIYFFDPLAGNNIEKDYDNDLSDELAKARAGWNRKFDAMQDGEFVEMPLDEATKMYEAFKASQEIEDIEFEIVEPKQLPGSNAE